MSEPLYILAVAVVILGLMRVLRRSRTLTGD